MRFASVNSAQASWLQRLLAMLCVGLIGFLGVAGASAELHARVHADQHHAQESGAPLKSAAAAHHDGCAIDLFAQGVSHAVEQPCVVAAEQTGESLYQTVAEQAAPTKPAGLFPPPCGPPLK